MGNDAADVVTKFPGDGQIGNDTTDVVASSENVADLVTTPGFIRVRKRRLQDSIWRRCARYSMSFDLVRAERINGQPRHKFVLGLGSQQSPPRYWIKRAVYIRNGCQGRRAGR